MLIFPIIMGSILLMVVTGGISILKRLNPVKLKGLYYGAAVMLVGLGYINGLFLILTSSLYSKTHPYSKWNHFTVTSDKLSISMQGGEKVEYFTQQLTTFGFKWREVKIKRGSQDRIVLLDLTFFLPHMFFTLANVQIGYEKQTIKENQERIEAFLKSPANLVNNKWYKWYIKGEQCMKYRFIGYELALILKIIPFLF